MRIYRREVRDRPGSGAKLVGTVEAVNDGARRHFKSFEELWTILTGADSRPTPLGKARP